MSKLKTVGRLAIAGAAIVALAGCTVLEPPAAEEPQIDLAAEEQAVRAVNEKWLELYKARDAEGIGGLFVEDGWTLVAGEGLSEGRAAIVATIEGGFQNTPDATVEWGPKQVWVATSGDLAVERGWWKADEDGLGDVEEIDGEYLTVFTKVNGEWKVLADVGAPVAGPGDDD